MITFVTKGPKVGVCNICGKNGQLTEDHTPPKGCIKPTSIVLQHLAHQLVAETPFGKGLLSHSGIKYRSLCPSCNNDLLGGRYDKTLIQFSNEIAGYLASPIQLPNEMTVRSNPQKLMRAVIGHLCAQGVDRYQKGPNTEPLRDYMLDDTLPLPNGIKVYCWCYPYKPMVLYRDAVYRELGPAQHVVMWIMKFYPVAFMVIWDNDNCYNFPLNELSKYRDAHLDREADLPVRLRQHPPQLWPEAPTDGHIMLLGREAIFTKDLRT